MVEFLNLKKINDRFEGELREAADRVIKSGWYALGEEVAAFEREFAEYCGAKFCVGVGNGLEALRLSLLAMGGESDRNEAIYSAKIQRELGWKSEFNFQRGLEITIDWYLNKYMKKSGK
jgi:nucleoside-diphosphate-sugar epimerase